MHGASWNEVLFASTNGNSLFTDDQRVAALHDDHIFVVVVNVGSRTCRFVARPKSHLAFICPIKHIAFHAWRRLALFCDSVRSRTHELGKFIHTHCPSKMT